MSFARAKALGWSTGEELSATEINTIDDNASKAIDGYAGGTYAPSSPIVLTTGAVRIQPGVGTVQYSTGAYPTCTSRTIPMMVPLVANYISDNATTSSCSTLGNDFYFASTTCTYYQSWATVGAGTPKLIIPWQPVPYHGTLTQLAFSFKGSSGHSDLPTVPPTLELLQLEYDGTLTQRVLLTDASVSTAAYQAQHFVSNASLNIDINGSEWKTWYFRFSGEGGTNSEIDGELLGIRTIMTVTDIRP